MHILIATDADWIVDEVTSALGDDATYIVCRDGRAVAAQVIEYEPALAVLDLQIGSMGGMAVTMSLRLDESGGTAPHVPVLMLLDRRADLHLARRSGAEGWLIKPLDALRLRRAATTVIDGGRWTEGIPVEEPEVVDTDVDTDADGESDVDAEEPDAPAEHEDSAEEEPASAG